MNDLSRQFGGNFAMNTVEFTPQLQSEMINNYFNPTGKGLYNTLSESYGKTQQNETESLKQEIAQLKETIERNASNNAVASNQGMNQSIPAQQPNDVYRQPATNDNSSTSLSEVDKLLNELFGGNSETSPQTSQQTPNEPTPTQERPQETVRPLIESSRITHVARDMGHNPDEVTQFIGSLTERDLVELFDAYKKQMQNMNNANNNVNTQRQNTVSPPSISEMPRGNNVVANQFPFPAQRHPIFG